MGEVQPAPSHVDRMKVEFGELAERKDRLVKFLNSEAFQALDAEDQRLLAQQHAAMTKYCKALSARIARATA
tara:strand:+ start:556 stop:771 length:216 start_codon:yes stop_codon:yes gene_type:complete